MSQALLHHDSDPTQCAHWQKGRFNCTKRQRIKGSALLSKLRYSFSISAGLVFAWLVFLFDEIAPNIVFFAVALVSGVSSSMCIYLGAVLHVDSNIALLILSGGQCAMQLHYLLGVKSRAKRFAYVGGGMLLNSVCMWIVFRFAYL